MPRVLSASSCLTCRRRKLKCQLRQIKKGRFSYRSLPIGDEKEPICDRCQKAGRYCDRNHSLKLHRHQPGSTSPEPDCKDDKPVDVLQSPGTARLFHHYISHLAAWYDLSDASRDFTRRVPREALSRPLLFNAVIAFAAIHQSRTGVPSLQSKADQHHARCVQLLINLGDDEVRAPDGVALAAVCLLRSYEILAEDFDPNRHLSGAYALAASQHVDFSIPSLSRAGFFNYLREDITFSLMTRKPLKLDSERIDTFYPAVTDEDQLNVASLHLARIINVAFSNGLSQNEGEFLSEQLEKWRGTLPQYFQPYHESNASSDSVFPSIWMLAECHASVAHYYIVAKSILRAYVQAERHPLAHLQPLAARLCGIAFTYDRPSVLVNWFGPVCFCGRFLYEKSLQVELVRRLQGCRRETGWPVQRFVEDLQRHWDDETG